MGAQITNQAKQPQVSNIQAQDDRGRAEQLASSAPPATTVLPNAPSKSAPSAKPNALAAPAPVAPKATPLKVNGADYADFSPGAKAYGVAHGKTELEQSAAAQKFAALDHAATTGDANGALRLSDVTLKGFDEFKKTNTVDSTTEQKVGLLKGETEKLKASQKNLDEKTANLNKAQADLGKAGKPGSPAYAKALGAYTKAVADYDAAKAQVKADTAQVEKRAAEVQANLP